jgi:deferrochelatase/peroxidase EfeB
MRAFPLSCSAQPSVSQLFIRNSIRSVRLVVPRYRNLASKSKSLLRHNTCPSSSGPRKMSSTTQINSFKPQDINTPLTRAAVFLVCTINDTPDAIRTIKATLANIDGTAKTVAFRDQTANFACTVGIGSNAWERLIEQPRPKELRPLPVIKGNTHSTVSTPGDLLFQVSIRSKVFCRTIY